MASSTLSDLLEHMVRDMYYVEQKIAKALPKMAEASESSELKAAFEEHLAETEEQVRRLEQVFEALGQTPRGKTCPAIDGLVEEAEEIVRDAEDDDTRDAGLIAMAQGVEHYEIARYGTMVAFARELEFEDVAEILQTTLDEEYTADQKLSALAEGRLNAEAVS